MSITRIELYDYELDGTHFVNVQFEDGCCIVQTTETLTDSKGNLKYGAGYSLPIPKYEPEKKKKKKGDKSL